MPKAFPYIFGEKAAARFGFLLLLLHGCNHVSGVYPAASRQSVRQRMMILGEVSGSLGADFWPLEDHAGLELGQLLALCDGLAVAAGAHVHAEHGAVRGSRKHQRVVQRGRVQCTLGEKKKRSTRKKMGGSCRQAASRVTRVLRELTAPTKPWTNVLEPCRVSTRTR